jgi:hypothetical protein
MNKRIVFISFCMAIAACGQSANNDTPQQSAAAACEAEAISRIGEKTYQLDIAALAASAKMAEDVWELSVPVIINPGLRDEVKQTLECKVRVQQGKPNEVTYINFIF